MAHDLMTRNGKTAMFCTGDRNSAWHKLGQRTPDCVTWEQAIVLAGLDWEVEKRQLFATDANGNPQPIPVFGTFRKDDDQFLGGTVGDGYAVMQNRDAFATCDALITAANGAHYESAGALGNGERVWTLARIPEADFIIDGGDQHKSYILVATSHDGSLAYTIKLVDERVVCSNTLAVALSETGQFFKVRHTSNSKQRLDAAQQVLIEAKDKAIGLRRKMELLAETKLTRATTEKILDRLFPKPKDPEANKTRRENLLADVLKLYEYNDANAYPSIKGTAYNLLNAVTEYTDHERTARGNGSQPAQMAVARSESALFGSGDALKTRALDVILYETAKDAPGLLDRVTLATGR